MSRSQGFLLPLALFLANCNGWSGNEAVAGREPSSDSMKQENGSEEYPTLQGRWAASAAECPAKSLIIGVDEKHEFLLVADNEFCILRTQAGIGIGGDVRFDAYCNSLAGQPHIQSISANFHRPDNIIVQRYEREVPKQRHLDLVRCKEALK